MPELKELYTMKGELQTQSEIIGARLQAVNKQIVDELNRNADGQKPVTPEVVHSGNSNG